MSPESVYVAPEVGHRFRRKPDGFFKIALTRLIEERTRIREELENLVAEPTTRKVLQERARAVKLITNACYGYAGWAGARWYVREVAESAAAYGRQLITEAIEKAKQLGLDVIYSDTDSIFVSNDKQKIDGLIDWVKQHPDNEDSDLEIRIDTEYDRVLFTEAMKRYAGLRKDGTLDIVGLEVIRGDWSETAQKVQEEVLNAILRNHSVEMAVEAVRKTIRRIVNGEVPLEELIIRRVLTKPIERYRVRLPHVEVARNLAREGWAIDVGEKIPYLIVKGKRALFQRARPYFEVKREEVDVEYYVENQVKPAAMRILEVFGVSELQLSV
jgi:DNA polymerase I